MLILALLLGESLEPPRDVDGDDYHLLLVSYEARRRPMPESLAQHYDWLLGREVQS